MATIRDVARMAQVSVSTVSLFYSQPSRVSEATKQRVCAAIEQLQYHPNGTARDLRVRKTHTIAVLLHNLSGPFYSELISGVEEVSDSLGLTTIAAGSSKNQAQGSLRLLREGRVDGAIVLDPAIDSADLLRYANASLPIVVLDRSLSAVLQSQFVTAVTADHRTGGYLAAQHLLDRGFSRFAVIAGPVESEDSRLRQLGFFQGLGEAGIDTITVPVVHGDFTEQGGARAAAVIAGSAASFDAVFVANDEMAIGAIQVLGRHGLKVPQDIAVMGFDDIRLARYITPPLSTIHQPMYELGMAAMKHLHRAMTSTGPVPAEVLPVTLVARASTAPHQKAGEHTNAS